MAILKNGKIISGPFSPENIIQLKLEAIRYSFVDNHKCEVYFMNIIFQKF